MAEERIDGRDREGGHLQGLRGRYWKPRNTLPASSTTCTSIRSTRSSGRGPSGVWRMRSRQPSRNSTRFPNLGRRRSWESSWRLGSRKLFEEAWSYAPKSQSSIIPFCLAGVARRLTPPQTIDFPEARFERSRFAADAIACSKQAASEIRDMHTNRSQASASRVLQNGLARVTMKRS